MASPSVVVPATHGTQAVNATARVALRRAMGLAFGIAISIGTTIGAGVFRAPGDIATQVPSPTLFYLIWVVGGCYALLGANALTELATTLPESGGQYVYARAAFGPYVGFVVGWSDYLGTCGTLAAIAIVIADAAGGLSATLGQHRLATAAAVIVALTVLVWRDVHWGERTQQLTSAVKAVALIGLAMACFAYRSPAGVLAAPTAPSLPHALGLASVVLGLQAVIYTYDGWTGPLYFSEEIQDSARNLPRAMFGGLALTMFIYVALVAGYVHVLTLGGVAQTPIAAASAAGVIFGNRGEAIVRWIIVLALPSVISANLLDASRVAFAMSRDGMATSRAAQVNRGGSPVVALCASAIVGLLFLITRTFESVIALLAFFFVANYAVSFAAVFVLRRRHPDWRRPYRARGHPWTTGIALVGSFAFLVGAVAGDPTRSGYALGLLALSYPLYRLLTRRTASGSSPVA